ncbi:MAG: hypothetical protein ACOYNN_18290 [Terrimicrobiaceae bacterium]
MGVPVQAIGEDVTWTTDPENAAFFIRGVPGFIPVSVAEAAFVGSMTAWLVSQGYHNFEYSVDDDNNVLLLEYGRTEVAVPLAKGRDSMVDALAAACKEVGGNGN